MLVTLAAMKTFLNIPTLTTTWDSFLTQQILVISDAIEEYCNRKFASTTYTQTFYKEDFNSPVYEMPLYHYPLTALTSIVERDVAAGTPTTIANYRYHLPSAIVTMNVGGRFFASGKILEIAYTAGFTTIPNLVTNVVLNLVQERYNKMINGVDLNFGSDVQRISIPGTISIDFDYSLQQNERKTHFGQLLGNHINVLDGFRSERALVGSTRLSYVV